MDSPSKNQLDSLSKKPMDSPSKKSLDRTGLGVSFWFSEEGKYSSEELADMYADMALRQLGVETV